MAQIKNHKDRKTRKSKAKAYLFAAVSSTIFTRVMSLKSAKAIWDYLKTEYEGNERIKGMQVLNLIRDFELQKMKESETIKEYSNKLLSIANKAQEQRRVMRQGGVVEGALPVKNQEEGKMRKKKYKKNFAASGDATANSNKNKTEASVNQLGHEAVICKGKAQQQEVEAQVADQKVED
ncbi:hypothetical protein F0562_011854 [Nyssa sinensis]|uniref:Uncharacterized protein n=1 Tax=Nyssa sinensis TaxID=561372 RepID=A0A5J4ZSY4_9ASTE|nr:hypothetical protein F0562_011854 [Nyssa sinensis]